MLGTEAVSNSRMGLKPPDPSCGLPPVQLMAMGRTVRWSPLPYALVKKPKAFQLWEAFSVMAMDLGGDCLQLVTTQSLVSMIQHKEPST